jgi:hypothetical protein
MRSLLLHDIDSLDGAGAPTGAATVISPCFEVELCLLLEVVIVAIARAAAGGAHVEAFVVANAICLKLRLGGGLEHVARDAPGEDRSALAFTKADATTLLTRAPRNKWKPARRA